MIAAVIDLKLSSGAAVTMRSGVAPRNTCSRLYITDVQPHSVRHHRSNVSQYGQGSGFINHRGRDLRGRNQPVRRHTEPSRPQ
jgi:hypothetical protein